MIGHGIEGTDGGLQEYLNLTDTEQALTAICMRKARAWELEQMAKIWGG